MLPVTQASFNLRDQLGRVPSHWPLKRKAHYLMHCAFLEMPTSTKANINTITSHSQRVEPNDRISKTS